MKVIIATATTPFVFGGATLMVDWLEEALLSRGHEVETYRIPVWTHPDDFAAQLVALRHWDFTGHGDRLIAIRTPSYLVRHHSKVVWFLHHLRSSYDLWDVVPDVPDDGSGREYRRMMFASDEVALAECKTVFTNSQTVADRLSYFNDIPAEVLYPPLGESIKYSTGAYGDSLVYVSRVVGHKRQLLAVQALAHTRTPVQLVIAGKSADGTYSDRISSEIDRLGLSRRVRFLNTVISEETKDDFMSEALGVVYIPLDEDSYGYVGLEAVASQKPLIITTDSGGGLELVKDGVNGFIAEPTPESLAAAYDKLFENRDLAARMGAAQTERAGALNISWDHVVERLLA
jgi:glycosyltransferase involved in cell wall biosynthesis